MVAAVIGAGAVVGVEDVGWHRGLLRGQQGAIPALCRRGWQLVVRPSRGPDPHRVRRKWKRHLYLYLLDRLLFTLCTSS